MVDSISALLEAGRLIGSPEGVINELVKIKNSSNRNITSVIPDMLKVASTLFFGFRFIPIFSVVPAIAQQIQWRCIPSYESLLRLETPNNYTPNKQ